jgi:LysM repeat protein
VRPGSRTIATVADTSASEGSSPRISWGNRLFALIALIAVLLAIGAIVRANTGDGNKSERAATAHINSENSGGSGDGAENPKTYVIEDGDTLTGIADKFGVSIKRLERLNPDLDPQTMGSGQELQIR